MSDYYEVEKIIEGRYLKSKRRWIYQIKWVGYPSEQNTWEPEKHLKRLGTMLAEFKKRNSGKPAALIAPIVKTIQKSVKKPITHKKPAVEPTIQPSN